MGGLTEHSLDFQGEADRCVFVKGVGSHNSISFSECEDGGGEIVTEFCGVRETYKLDGEEFNGFLTRFNGEHKSAHDNTVMPLADRLLPVMPASKVVDLLVGQMRGNISSGQFNGIVSEWAGSEGKYMEGYKQFYERAVEEGFFDKLPEFQSDVKVYKEAALEIGKDIFSDRGGDKVWQGEVQIQRLEPPVCAQLVDVECPDVTSEPDVLKQEPSVKVSF